MPTYSKIILTNSNTTTSVPDANDLDHGELAINYVDGKLFFKDNDNIIQTLASNIDLASHTAHINVTSGNPHGVTAEDLGLAAFENETPAELGISDDTQAELNQKAEAEDVADLITLTGVDVNSEDLGSFDGSTITNNSTIKSALQSLETAVEGRITLTELSAHTGNTNNPHGVTATQLGLVIGTNVQAYNSVLDSTTASYTTADETKLGNIEDNADVTDTDNVTTAGALMDTEVTSLNGIKTLTVPDNTTISTFGATLVDDVDDATARATLGLGTMSTQAAGSVDIDGGTIDGTSIGATTASTGNFTTLDAGSVDIDGGTIDGTVIGATTPSTGNFTTLAVTSITTTNIVASQEFGFKNTPTNSVTQPIESANINTGVTINSPAGTITCVGHTFLTDTPETFTVSNDKVSETDVIILSFKNGYEELSAKITDVSSGSFDITVYDYHNQSVDTTSSPIEINFAVIRHDIS